MPAKLSADHPGKLSGAIEVAASVPPITVSSVLTQAASALAAMNAAASFAGILCNMGDIWILLVEAGGILVLVLSLVWWTMRGKR